MRYLLFFILYFLFELHTIYGQSYPYRHYTVDDGLNSNTVYDVIQDTKGFIWFATSAGVCRFDGNRFKKFTVDDGLADNEVLKIKLDEKGRLWLLNFNGTISIIEGESVIADSSYPFLKKIGPGFYFYEMFFDSLGQYWLMNKSPKGIKVILPATVENLNYDSVPIFQTKLGNWKNSTSNLQQVNPGAENYPSKAKLLQWCYYKDSMLVMLSDSGIITVDRNNSVERTYVDYPLPVLPSKIYCDDKLGFWVTGTKNGVFFYEKTKEGYKLFDVFLKGEFVTSVLKDNEGNIWFTIHGGGVIMLPWNFKSVLSYSKNEGLKDNEVYAITVDKKNRIWFGHKYGLVDRIDRGKFEYLKVPNLSNNLGRVLKIAEHPMGYMIIAGDDGMSFVKQSAGKDKPIPVKFSMPERVTEIQPIKDFFITDSGDVLIVSQVAIHSISGKDIATEHFVANRLSLPIKRYYAVCTDSIGNIWFSDFDGVGRIKNNIPVSLKNIHPLLGKRIVDMCAFDGKILLSVLGYGLLLLDNDSIVKHFTIADGLLSNNCVRLFQKKEKVYACTNEGLNIISQDSNKDYTILRVTTADGLISNQINDIYADDKNIYVATLKGTSVINERSIKQQITPLPVVYFTKVLWQGKDITKLKSPKIGYIDKYLRFDFISPYFIFPQGVIYQYNLNNGNWISTVNTTLEFNSLIPGEYTLQIRARHSDSEWSRPIDYSFIILQPFYATNWFYLLLLLMLITSMAIIYGLRIRRMRKEQDVKLEYEQKINYLQNQALQAMVNPHFIFNSLSAIQQQINAGNSLKAGSYLSRFAKLLRKNLETINENNISLSEEIDRLNLYLESEKMRLEEKLEYEIITSLNIPTGEIMIPSMVLQPLLENAIWHGILPKGGGMLKINIDADNSFLKIIIEDNGIGINQSSKLPENESSRKHFGMKITRERLVLLEKKLKKQVDFIITDLSIEGKTGTRVYISLPLITID